MSYFTKYSVIIFLFLSIAISSCYKKELDEFKNAVFEANTEIAFPLFNADVSIKDSISVPYLPNFSLSDSLYLTNNYTLGLSDSLSLLLDGYTINDIQIKLYIKNSFPLKGNLQVYFLDANNIVTDSLFTIEKHSVQNGTDGTMNISEVYIDIDQSKYKKIIDCKKAKIAYSIKKDNSNITNSELFIGCGVILKTGKKL